MVALYDRHGLGHVSGWESYDLHDLACFFLFPGLELYLADSAHHIAATDNDLDYLDDLDNPLSICMVYMI